MDNVSVFNLISVAVISILMGVSYVRFLTVHPIRIGLYAFFPHYFSLQS